MFDQIGNPKDSFFALRLNYGNDLLSGGMFVSECQVLMVSQW